MCLKPRLLNKGVTVALYWDVKCLWFHSSNFALNVCQNNTKMIYFDKIVQPLNSFWCFLFSCPYQCVALQVSGFPTGLFVALLVSGSLYLRVTTCVHTCLSCWCFLSVCVCFLFCLSGSMTPLCVSVFACRLIIHTLNAGQKQLGLIQQHPVIAHCCWSPHIQKHFNTVLWPNTQISWHLCCLQITSGFFFFLSHNFLSYKLFLAIIRFSLGMFTVHILCTIDEE